MQHKISTMTGFSGYNPATDGRAAILVLETTDGPLRLELPAEQLHTMFAALMQVSVACEARGNTQPPMNEVDAARGTLMPASDLHVLDVKGAYKRLAIRVGMVDFNVMIGSRPAAQALAQALMEPPTPQPR